MDGVNFGTAEGYIPFSGTTDINSGYYWPTGTMDFYAVSPVCESADVSYSTTDSKVVAKLEDVVVGVTVSEKSYLDATSQTDWLYAVTLDESKQTTSVPLNFQHALAQVDFKVKIDGQVSQNIKVNVKSVTVKNLVSKGTYTLPNTTTLNTESDGKVTSYGNTGTWNLSTESSDVKDYYVAFANNTTIDNDETTDAGIETAVCSSMLLLPQKQETAATYSNSNWSTNGLFILDTEVVAVVGEGDDAVEINLVNSPTYVPVTFEWNEGYRYTYTFVYTYNGNGGVTADGKDQLLPIKFDLTVDEMQQPDAQKVDVNLAPAEEETPENQENGGANEDPENDTTTPEIP